MSVSYASGLNFEGNIISGSEGVGMVMTQVTGSDITGNSFQDNIMGGIKLTDGCGEFTCTKNVIRGGGFAMKVMNSGTGMDIKLKNNDITACETGISCTEQGMAYMVGNSFEAVQKKVTADSDGLVTLSKPRDFTATEDGFSAITVTWKSVDEASGINLYRKKTGSDEFQLIASGDSGTIFRDDSLEQGTNYVYRLVPFIYVGEERIENTPSDDASARTKISMDSVKLTVASAAGFTARPVAPDFSVKYKGRELIPGVDYDYSYDNNLYIGTATLTVKGKGDFVGTQTAGYEIKFGAPRLNVAAAKTPGLAGITEKRKYEVKVSRWGSEVLAVGNMPLDPFRRTFDSIKMQSGIKITAWSGAWDASGSGFVFGA